MPLSVAAAAALAAVFTVEACGTCAAACGGRVTVAVQKLHPSVAGVLPAKAEACVRDSCVTVTMRNEVHDPACHPLEPVPGELCVEPSGSHPATLVIPPTRAIRRKGVAPAKLTITADDGRVVYSHNMAIEITKNEKCGNVCWHGAAEFPDCLIERGSLPRC